MRGSLRLLAKVQPGRLLESNAPTGITGLLTHPHPRPTLIYTYKQILSKLKAVPESSVYRQSTEATTRSRLKIVEDTVPAGYEAWQTRVKEKIAQNPEAYKHATLEDGSLAFTVPPSDRDEEGMKKRTAPFQEGAYSEASAKAKTEAIKAEEEEVDSQKGPTIEELEVEPPLDADQYGYSSISNLQELTGTLPES